MTGRREQQGRAAMTRMIRGSTAAMFAAASLALAGCASSDTQTAMGPYSGKEEAVNMRLVGYHDLSARTAALRGYL